jgi:hypothetical protein
MERAGALIGSGRAAASRIPSSGGGGLSQIWQPGKYYAPGVSPQSQDVAGVSALSGAGDILWGFLQPFSVAGQITALATTLSNPTNGAGKATMALYAYDSDNPIQPGALLHSYQCAGQGFSGVYSETGLAISVAAGDALWFVSHGTLSGVDVYSGGVPCLLANQLVAGFGTVWTVATPTATPLTIRGLRKSSVYAYPPPDPFPSVTSTGTPASGHVGDVFLSTLASAMPLFFFQFSPT